MSEDVGIPDGLLAAADQEQIRSRVTRLVLRMLDEFEDQLETATPQARRELLKSTIPAMMKSLEQSDTASAEMAELRAQVTALFGGVRSGLLGEQVSR